MEIYADCDFIARHNPDTIEITNGPMSDIRQIRISLPVTMILLVCPLWQDEESLRCCPSRQLRQVVLAWLSKNNSARSNVWFLGYNRQWCTHYRYHIVRNGSEYLPSEYVLAVQQDLFLNEKRTPECVYQM